MTRLRVDHVTGDRFSVAVRGHQLAVDQPVTDGGTDAGPAPVELFVAGIASCVAFYARRYLARHGLPEDPLRVLTDYDMAKGPARIANITIDLELPSALSAESREAALAMANHCTLHNTLRVPPRLVIRLVDAAESAA